MDFVYLVPFFSPTFVMLRRFFLVLFVLVLFTQKKKKKIIIIIIIITKKREKKIIETFFKYEFCMLCIVLYCVAEEYFPFPIAMFAFLFTCCVSRPFFTTHRTP